METVIVSVRGYHDTAVAERVDVILYPQSHHHVEEFFVFVDICTLSAEYILGLPRRKRSPGGTHLVTRPSNQRRTDLGMKIVESSPLHRLNGTCNP